MNQTPEPCAPDIYKNGSLVMHTHTIGARETEEWVKSVAELSGQPVDWHFVGGRACILALGDLDKVRAAIMALMPEHDRLQREAVRKYTNLGEDYYGRFEPSCTLYGENESNPVHEYARQMNLDRDANSETD